MMKMKMAAMLVGVVGLCFQAGAVVTPVNIVLHDASTTYNIPSGKVLIIEHLVWNIESGYTFQGITIQSASEPAGVGDFNLTFNTDNPEIWTPPRPIRVIGGSGALVRILQNPTGADWRDVMIVGLLVDPQDLYAANISLELDNPRVTGSRLVADVAFASPRPRVVEVGSREVLPSFSSDATGEFAETASPSFGVASVAADTDVKQMAVRAIARVE